MTIGDRIKLARRRAGLSQQQLADQAASITKQSVSKYETGKSVPSSRVLLDLCRVLDVTLDFLMRPTSVELPEPHFRKLANMPQRTRSSLQAHVWDLLERQLALERIVHGADGPQFVGPRGIPASNAEEAEAAAQACRAGLNVGPGPIANLTALLESGGVRVVVTPAITVKGFDGLSGWVADAIPFVMVSGDPEKPGDRQRFTLAHELGHLVLTCPQYLDARQTERVVDRFAGALLVPREAIIRELGDTRSDLAWGELWRLKHIYGVSMSSLLVRAHQCDIIRQSRYEQLWRQLSRRGWRKREPDPQVPREVPTAMARLSDRVLAEDLVSLGRAAELCGTTVAELQARRDGEMLSTCV